MNRMLWWAAPALALVVIGAGGGYYCWTRSRSSAPVPASSTVAAAPAAGAEPRIRHPIEMFPVPVDERTKSLPPLGVSDTAMRDALAGLVGDQPFAAVFHADRIIPRIVATIDNLPRAAASMRVMPVRPVPGMFATVGAGDDVVIGQDNPARYAAYVKIAEAIDVRRAVDLYARFYPLFQQAYVELGYPQGYFNDRLIEAIDDLLAAPELRGPIRLAQPKVLYAYADPGLEARSAGQKIMVRMGADNAAKLKARLREIRQEVLRRAPAG